MATTDIKAGRLVVETAARLDGLDRSFRQMEDRAKRAGTRAGAGITEGLERAAARGQRSGDRLAQRYAHALKRRLEAETGQIRARAAAGLLSPAQAEAQGRAAGERYNRGLQQGMRKLEGQGRLTRGGAGILGNAGVDAAALGADLGRSSEQSVGALRRIGMAAKLWIAGAVVSAGLAGAMAIRGLFRSLQAAEERAKSFLRLNSAARLFNVSQEHMIELSQHARREYRLSATAANELAVETTKLAAKAGDASQAQELLARALDLGAAQGLEASRVALALNQTLRGIDEGTDLLLQQNPSQIYAEYAASIGKVAGALSDQEQKQALVWKIMKAGETVQGAYGEYLESNIGGLAKWRLRLTEAREEIGTHFLPVAVRLAQTFEGPLAGAVKIITGLLDAMVPALDRAINRMRDLGVEAARIRPLELMQERQRIEQALPDLRIRAGRLAYRAGLGDVLQRGEDGRPVVPEQAVERVRRETAEALARAEREGNAEAIELWMKRTAALEEYEATMQELIATEGALDAIRDELPSAREKAAAQQRLDAVNREIAALEELGDTMLGGEARRLEALRAEAERLRISIHGPDAPEEETGGGDVDPEKQKKLAELIAAGRKIGDELNAALAQRTAMAALEAHEALEEVGRSYVRLTEHGLTAFEEIPAPFAELLSRLGALDDQIEQTEEHFKALREAGMAVPEGAQAALEHLRAQRTAAAQAAAAWAETLPDLRATLRDLPALAQAIAQGLDPREVAEFSEELNRLGHATLQVRIAEEELTTARLLHGEESREAERAERNLDNARAAAAETYRTVARAVLASNIPLAAQRDILRAIAAALKDVDAAQEDTNDGWGQFATVATETARVVRGLASVGRELGLISEQQQKVLEGFADMAEGAASFAAAAATQNVPGMITSGIQIIGGAFKALSGPDKEEQRRKHLEHMRMLNHNTRALESLADAVLSDQTTREREGLLAAGNAVESELGAVFDSFIQNGWRTWRPKLTAEQVDFFERLEELTGMEFFSEDGTINIEAYRKAWEAFQDLELGAFADDLTGRLDALGWTFERLGDRAGTAEERFQQWLQTVGAFTAGGTFGAGLQEAFAKGGLPAAQAYLDAVAKAFAEGGVEAVAGLFGTDLTAAEIQRIIEEAYGAVPGGGGIIGGGAEATRLSVNITEVQANQMLAVLFSSLTELRAIRALLGGGTAPVVTPATLPPPGGAPSGSHVDVGGITVHLEGGPGLTPDNARAIGASVGAAAGEAFSRRIGAALRGAGAQNTHRIPARAGGLE